MDLHPQVCKFTCFCRLWSDDDAVHPAATPAPQKKLKTNINVDRLKPLLKQEETVKVQTKKEPQDQPQLPKPKAKNKNLSLAETAKQQLESSHFRSVPPSLQSYKNVMVKFGYCFQVLIHENM